ncbi:MAG: prephenate dehydratase [Candidatus Omnitrophota bacterium]
MDLKKLRLKIDLIDRRIVDLLNERAMLTIDIGHFKHRKGLSIYAPNREKEVYRKLGSLNKGPLGANALKEIYREIMSSALNLEKPLKVAYLGPELTFTHLAALEKFGKSVSYEACKTITDVFNCVDKDRCDYGVVPIENSIEGAVNHTLDMFMNSELKICAEAYLEISHNLMGRVTDRKKIKYVYSNPQVFGQCRSWLEANLPNVMLRETHSTAEAAGIAARDRRAACIASQLAREKYGLKMIARSIEDAPHNVTRFLVIANDMAEPTGSDKTSVMFSLKDRVGALHDILTPFKKHRINLTKIESRPSKLMAWKYYFFVDLVGHVKNEKVTLTLKELEKACAFLKVLGSYPTSE